MENFNVFIDYIARTNLFNFVIFLSIIIFLVKKINVTAKLEDAQVAVKDSIVEAETAKVKSEERLSSIEESMAHIEEEIDSIIEKSEENAKLVGEKVVQDGKKTALVIQDNTVKAIENSRVILKNELLRRASLASVEVARGQILNELSNNKELHDKLIDESIEAIEMANAEVSEGVN